MHESSDWVYTLTLNRNELITLTMAMEAVNRYTDKGFPLWPKNMNEEFESIYSRLVEMEMNSCPHQAQPTVDMAAVNLAFTRIREALAEADQAINSQKEV